MAYFPFVQMSAELATFKEVSSILVKAVWLIETLSNVQNIPSFHHHHHTVAEVHATYKILCNYLPRD